MNQIVDVFKIPCGGPADLRAAKALLQSGALRAQDIVAVMGKTEGNGCVNDFTRELASRAWCDLLAPLLGTTPEAVHARVALVMSGGTEGVLSPHFTVFARRASTTDAPRTDKRLAIGIAFTREFKPEELGRRAQVNATAEAVTQAMRDAGIDDAGDVHFVQIKCPLLTAQKIDEALQRGAPPVTHDTYESMGASRGASALGVAVALGEIDTAQVQDEDIRSDWSLYSSVASTSAGIELDHNVIIVMGMSAQADSDYLIAHGVMRDAIDVAGVRRCLREDFGIDPDTQSEALRQRVVNVLAKAEAAPDGKVRGARHTMLNDSDINSTRHARAAVGAALASVLGDTALYVSGGAEHQGPAGGGPFALILRA
ncbi:ring-opening amidohydrolase [Uliginosibacterium sp. H3]|uniref:Cyanuric acid amidohydrolase n=1 Tax=Uliginosibacterium silvisoli TaxID=3114758 RepID=A0ABU6JZF6_9RHOO|nr:ring-opening amidohydrolase [Uliginosibacterium sp. H3]